MTVVDELARSAFVTKPVAVNELVAVKLGVETDEGVIAPREKVSDGVEPPLDVHETPFAVMHDTELTVPNVAGSRP